MHVMIVDDHATNRELCRFMLSHLAEQVTTFENGQGVVEAEVGANLRDHLLVHARLQQAGRRVPGRDVEDDEDDGGHTEDEGNRSEQSPDEVPGHADPFRDAGLSGPSGRSTSPGCWSSRRAHPSAHPGRDRSPRPGGRRSRGRCTGAPH